MYMPAFQAKKLVKGVSDETEVNGLQAPWPARPGRALPLRSRPWRCGTSDQPAQVATVASSFDLVGFCVSTSQRWRAAAQE
jgi:hypothetical protein